VRPAAPSILWIASHLRYPSGHAEEARAFLCALEQEGHEPSAIEMARMGTERSVPLSEEELARLVRQMERRPDDPVVAVHAYTPKADRDYGVPAAVAVARAMFETDRLPDGWTVPLASKEQVWVPSMHNYEVFAAGGVPESKLRILGQTLDFETYDPDTAEPIDLGAPDDHLVFLSNFDFSERKGWRRLLMGWARAFDAHDPVCLVLKTLSVAKWDEDYIHQRIRHFLDVELGAGSGNRLAPIEILPCRVGPHELPPFYAAADAYVSVSRGEAWGRTYMEAMAMELPTVGSRYGGNLDFMSDDDCWLIDGELVPVASHAEVLNDLYMGHRWFEADVDELARVLREIASDPTAAREKARGTRARLMSEFGPEPITRRILELAESAVLSVEEPSAA